MLARAIEQLGAYFAGDRQVFDLPIDLASLDPATRQVLLALQQVPYGRAVTYGELADAQRHRPAGPSDRLGDGSQPGSDPDRLSPRDGRRRSRRLLGRPAGQGLETKRWLLEHEGILPPRLL